MFQCGRKSSFLRMRSREWAWNRPNRSRFAPARFPIAGHVSEDPGTESVVAAFETVVVGGGPAGLDRRLRADPAWPVVRRARGRSPDGRRHQPDRRVQGVPVRHRRASLLLQERRGQRPLEGDPGRSVHHPLAAEPDLLQPQVLPLPAQAGGRSLEARSVAFRPDPAQLSQGATEADPAGTNVRGLGRQSVRPGSSSRSSSSRTPRSSGACPPARSRPTGRPSGSRA